MQNITSILFFVGMLLLILEVAVLGFSSLILLFIGAAFILTAALLWLGILPVSVTAIALTSGALTLIFAILLWKPLKKLQKTPEEKPLESDFLEHEFILSDDLNEFNKVSHQYSGITWQVKSSQAIPQGTLVKVVRCEVGVLWVEVKAS